MHFSSRNVFITVDGKKANLFIQESNKLIFKPSICDCNVIVYAVNDRKSFGVVNICFLNWFTYPRSLDIAVRIREGEKSNSCRKQNRPSQKQRSKPKGITQSSDRSLVILVHSYLLSLGGQKHGHSLRVKIYWNWSMGRFITNIYSFSFCFDIMFPYRDVFSFRSKIKITSY